MSERFVVKVGGLYLKVTDNRRRLSNVVSRRSDATEFYDRDEAVVWKDHEERERTMDEPPVKVRIAKIVARPKPVWACVCVHPYDKHGADGCVIEECPCLITRTEGFHRPFRGSGAVASEKACVILREWTRANQETTIQRGRPFLAGVERSIGYVAGLEFALKTLGIRS